MLYLAVSLRRFLCVPVPCVNCTNSIGRGRVRSKVLGVIGHFTGCQCNSRCMGVTWSRLQRIITNYILHSQCLHCTGKQANTEYMARLTQTLLWMFNSTARFLACIYVLRRRCRSLHRHEDDDCELISHMPPPRHFEVVPATPANLKFECAANG